MSRQAVNKDAIAQMRSLIDEQHHRMERVERLLEQERDAVAQQDMDALYPIIREKLTVADGLDSDERRRVDMLDAMDRSMDTLVDEAAAFDAGDLRSRWQSLIDKTRACKRYNESNGFIIEQRINRVENVIHRIREADRATAQTYTPKGMRQNDHHRELTRV